jgi:hypothetical protein
MSSTRLVVFEANTLIAPPAPAGTIAALERTRPSIELTVAATGCVCPVGQSVRNPKGTVGITATLSEYAAAVEGMLHDPDGIVKVRNVPPAIEGPANGPLGVVRVSTNRHGVTGT